MKITSFDGSSIEKIKRDPNQGDLFDLFQKNIMNDNGIELIPYTIPREYEMRLDRISEYLFGSTLYVEELMVMNNIINPYSVKEGQEIYYCDPSFLGNLFTKDELNDYTETKRQELINSSQPNRNSKNITDDTNLPPTIKPSNLKQIEVSKDNTIQIINTFE